MSSLRPPSTPPGAAIRTWLSYYQNNPSISVVIIQRKETEKIYLMFQFLLLIGTELVLCSVCHKDILQLYNPLGWRKRSHGISTSDSWIHLARKMSLAHTVFVYNPCSCPLVRNLCVKLLLEWLKKKFIFHSWSIVCLWIKHKMPMQDSNDGKLALCPHF